MTWCVLVDGTVGGALEGTTDSESGSPSKTERVCPTLAMCHVLIPSLLNPRVQPPLPISM